MRLASTILSLVSVTAVASAGGGAGTAEDVENETSEPTAGEQGGDMGSELEEYFEIIETTARVVDFAKNEEYDAQVLIFEPKEENVTEDETAPYIIMGERPKPSVSFIIGHPDLSIDSKHMTIFMNAPPETLPEDLRRIYYGGRLETEPAVEPTPEHMEGLAKP
jgi:hypothetical protein